MCCNYCFYFEECTKAGKTNPNCCHDCAEYEFCPFALGKTTAQDPDSSSPGENSDIDMFEGNEF